MDKNWIKVSDCMPENGKKVLLTYKNECGNWRRICGMYIAEKTMESVSDSDISEYDEETDTYYDPAGWYEIIENWEEYSYVAVTEPVTHWQELPPYPED